MNLLLVGGTGRSGTSLVYYRMILNDEVQGDKDFESMIFTKNNSLIDVYDVYINSYSPERLHHVCNRFKRQVYTKFSTKLPRHRLLRVQKILLPTRASEKVLPFERLVSVLDEFIQGLHDDRTAERPLLECFQIRSKILLEALFEFHADAHNILLEKTPHNVLVFHRIKKIFPHAKLLHIVRDPRAVAESVVRQNWGASSYKEAVDWVRLILDTWIMQYNKKEFDLSSCRCIRAEDLVTQYEQKENLIRQFTGEKLEKLTLKANPEALDWWRENISSDELDYATDTLKEIMQFFSYSPDIFNSTEQSLTTTFDKV